MRFLPIALASLTLLTQAIGSKPPGKDAILLSNVQTLTLRAHRMTSSRRVEPIPQLSCAGPSKKICSLYQPEVMRCTNQGHDYDTEDVQWTCKADLPPEFKLGATDVICEGYRNADDKWVLKGSCGVEYRMLLTEKGEKRFGSSHGDGYDWGKDLNGNRKMADLAANLIFGGFIVAVAVFIIWPGLLDCFGLRRNRRAPRGRGLGQGWGGGGGGGGGGPPPPYSPYDPGKSSGNQEGWKPGFWSGALGGAAAGYGMGRMSNPGSRTTRSRSDYGRSDPGEGSSRSPQFSSTTSSTGFGSTKRR